MGTELVYEKLTAFSHLVGDEKKKEFVKKHIIFALFAFNITPDQKGLTTYE